MNALSEIARLDNLRDAWKSVAKSGKLRTVANNRQFYFHDRSGTDHETIASFPKQLDANLKEIASQLKSNQYKFSSLRPVIIEKSNGKKRVICVPSVRDRIVQKVLLKFLCTRDNDRCGVANDVSYGFIPKRGVKLAAKRAEHLRGQKPWVYKTDICAFFDDLPRARLESDLRKVVKARTLHPLLIAAMRCEAKPRTTSQERELEKQGIMTGKGVRQGMPLSPLFSNILLKKFDAEIINSQLSMVRYADDLIILETSEKRCLAAHEIVKRALGLLGLEVHGLGGKDSKTQIFKPHEPADFLGVVIERNDLGYKVRLSNAQIRYLKARVADYASPEYLDENGITLRRIVSAIDGTIAGYQGAYDFCENFPNVVEAMWDKRQEVIRTAIQEVLEIDVSKLDERARRFLDYRS